MHVTIKMNKHTLTHKYCKSNIAMTNNLNSTSLKLTFVAETDESFTIQTHTRKTEN